MLGLRCSSAALLALLVMGCDPDESDSPHPSDIGDLSDRHACADLILVAADADATEGLFLTVDDGLVDEVLGSGEAIQARYDVGDERIELRWVTGTNVYAGHCGLDNGEPWQVDLVQQAIAGEVSIELVPSNEGPVLAVELRDVLLSPLGQGLAKHDAGEALPPMVFDELRVGR